MKFGEAVINSAACLKSCMRRAGLYLLPLSEQADTQGASGGL